MSWKLMVLVKDCEVGDSSAKFVLMMLAEHAHPDGSNAYPSVGRLVRDTKLDRRTVQRALGRLRELQFIKPVKPARQHYTTCYAINVDKVKAKRFPKYKSSAGRPYLGARDSWDFPGAWDDPTPAEQRAAMGMRVWSSKRGSGRLRPSERED